MTSIKTNLSAVVVLGSVSLAHANSFDPNLANRYPGLAEPGVYGYTAKGGAPVYLHQEQQQQHQLQSRDVSLPQRETGPVASELWIDRASQSFSGGGY